MIKVREFNEAGLVALEAFLSTVKANQWAQNDLDHLVASTDLSHVFTPAVEVEQRPLPTRAAAAEYLVDVFGASTVADMPWSPGVWAWLSAFFFHELCPAKKDGSRKPGELARWIPEGGAWRFYRHLLAGPTRICLAYGKQVERAGIVLCQPPHTPGDFVGQLAASQRLIESTAIIESASALYYDESRKSPKRGAAPNHPAPGTLRRFMAVMNQLDLTWDLNGMTAGSLLGLLPKEFDPWLVRPKRSG